jgi:hypothetical protein
VFTFTLRDTNLKRNCTKASLPLNILKVVKKLGVEYIAGVKQATDMVSKV